MGTLFIAMMRAGYREAKRIIKHGPSYPWRRYIAPAKILQTDAICTETEGSVTVCVLTSRKDWQACLWSLVSFYELSGLRLPLLIYSDGTLGEHELGHLGTVFPTARIVSSAEGETAVSKSLSGYPNCMRFRSAQVYARKIIDLPILCGSPFMLMIDSDVLFLKRPAELMKHLLSNRRGRFVFLRDFQDAYFASGLDIKTTFDIEISPRVNCGIMFADVSNFEYGKLERWLGQSGVQDHPWAEQTLWAMYARQERTDLLGKEYDVTLWPHLEPDTVVKHYIRPIREFMYVEGIPHLIRCLEQERNPLT